VAVYGDRHDALINAFNRSLNAYNQAHVQQVFLANTTGTAGSTGVSTVYPSTYTVTLETGFDLPNQRPADGSNVAWLNRRVDELRVRL